ncbi:hypothetical protein G4B88_007550, partial [Cannabis sativa]
QQAFFTNIALLPHILSLLGYNDLATAAPSLSADSSPSAWIGPFTLFTPSDTTLRSCISCSVPNLLREHIVPGLFYMDYLRNLAFGTKIETLSPGRCLTITAERSPLRSNETTSSKIFISGLEITQPDLFMTGEILIYDFHLFKSRPPPNSAGSSVRRSTPLRLALGVSRAMMEENWNKKKNGNEQVLGNNFGLNMTMGDWFQGPFVYYLYSTYGFGKGEIGQLFIAGFGSSMLFGTIVGSLADKHTCDLLYYLHTELYYQAFSQYRVLMVGRVLGEHNKRGFEQQWLSITFSKAIFLGNDLVAIVAGLLGNLLVDSLSLGPVAPFDAASCFLAIGMAVILSSWSENYGNPSGARTCLPNSGVLLWPLLLVDFKPFLGESDRNYSLSSVFYFDEFSFSFSYFFVIQMKKWHCSGQFSLCLRVQCIHLCFFGLPL